MKIYVASSWRNEWQPDVVDRLRQAGHEIYDFRNPKPGNKGFHWSEISENWQDWTPEQYKAALHHPLAATGFYLDYEALLDAECIVLVLPSGRSSHLEMGVAIGLAQERIRYHSIIFMPEPVEPELMYKMADAIVVTMDELVAAIDGITQKEKQ